MIGDDRCDRAGAGGHPAGGAGRRCGGEDVRRSGGSASRRGTVCHDWLVRTLREAGHEPDLAYQVGGVPDPGGAGGGRSGHRAGAAAGARSDAGGGGRAAAGARAGAAAVRAVADGGVAPAGDRGDGPGVACSLPPGPCLTMGQCHPPAGTAAVPSPSDLRAAGQLAQSADGHAAGRDADGALRRLRPAAARHRQHRWRPSRLREHSAPPTPVTPPAASSPASPVNGALSTRGVYFTETTRAVPAVHTVLDGERDLGRFPGYFMTSAPEIADAITARRADRLLALGPGRLEPHHRLHQHRDAALFRSGDRLVLGLAQRPMGQCLVPNQVVTVFEVPRDRMPKPPRFARGGPPRRFAGTGKHGRLRRSRGHPGPGRPSRLRGHVGPAARRLPREPAPQGGRRSPRTTGTASGAR